MEFPNQVNPNPTPYSLNRVPVIKDDSYKSFMPNLLLKLPDPNMDFWSDSKVGSVKMLVVFGKKGNRDKRLSLEIDCEYKTGWEQLFSLSTSLKTTTPQNH